MLLFHGTDNVSAKMIQAGIRLGIGAEKVDFEPGFYTTKSYDTAVKWARRKARIRKAKSAIVILEFDEAMADNMIERFDNDLRWGQFVINNRNGYSYINCIPKQEHNLDSKYDITYGRIADYDINDVAQRLAKQKEVLTDVKEILNPTYSFQYAFHTQKALNCIKVVEIKEEV